MDEITISTNKERLNIDYIHQFLSTQAYWSKEVPIEIVRRSIAGSMCFGVYAGNQQIGFARVISDLPPSVTWPMYLSTPPGAAAASAKNSWKRS